MSVKRLGCAMVLNLLLSLFSGAAEPETGAGYAPPDGRFPIMCWELPPRTAKFSDATHGLASVAECGFTTAGFVLPEQLPLCEKNGLIAMTCRPKWKTDWRKLTDEQIVETVKKRI